MQTDAQKNQEQIKIKLKELQELEQSGQLSGDLFEDDPQNPDQQQTPQEKLYDADQLEVAMWSETITNILVDCPMSEFKQIRLNSMRNRLLYEMDLEELIVRPKMPVELNEPVIQEHIYQEPEFEDGLAESRNIHRDTSGDIDLDIISQKLKDINKKGGLMEPEVQEPEPTGLQKLMGGLVKKKPAERSVAEGHQPISMG